MTQIQNLDVTNEAQVMFVCVLLLTFIKDGVIHASVGELKRFLS